MQDFRMYLCDSCGYSLDKAGFCPHCDLSLTVYNKDTQAQYQVDMEEAMRVMSEYKWYV